MPNELIEPWVADAVHRAVDGTLANLYELTGRAGFIEIVVSDADADAEAGGDADEPAEAA
jgi:hypothetical protein